MKGSHLRLGAVVESSSRGWNRGDELGEAGRPGDVAFTIGHTLLVGEIGGQGGQHGGIHVPQAVAEGG